MTQPHLRFDGATYDPTLDRQRLTSQLEAVKALMLDGRWRTLEDIAKATNQPAASVSARLRDLRKARFGGYEVHKVRACLSGGIWIYRVIKRFNRDAFDIDQCS